MYLENNKCRNFQKEVPQSHNVVLQNSFAVLRNHFVVLQNNNVVLQNDFAVLQSHNVVLQNNNVDLQNDNAILQSSSAGPEIDPVLEQKAVLVQVNNFVINDIGKQNE